MKGNELARQYMDTAWKIKSGIPTDHADIWLLSEHCAHIDPRGEPAFKDTP